jgi:hypothetical protein
MSRAYRISIRECQDRVIRAEDHVSTRLEILEVLPPEQMAGLLTEELKRRGFQLEGELLVRRQNDVTVTVDPAKGTVKVASEGSHQESIEVQREGRAYDDVGPHAREVREHLKKEAAQEIERKVKEQTAVLQNQVTDRLEGELGDVRHELDQAVNRVTAEALKIKAAQLGQIKEMTEDPQAGSLTIIVEV